jgi:hypothetical protein
VVAGGNGNGNGIVNGKQRPEHSELHF